MNLLEKLDELMQMNGLNKKTLSQISGIPYTTIDGLYKKGYANAKLPTLMNLASTLDVSIDYLVRDDIVDMHHGKTDGFQVSFDEMKHIETFRALSESGQLLLNSILSAIKQYEK